MARSRKRITWSLFELPSSPLVNVPHTPFGAAPEKKDEAHTSSAQTVSEMGRGRIARLQCWSLAADGA